MRRISPRTRTLIWLGIPVLAGGIVLTALWVVPVSGATVLIQWTDEIDPVRRAGFERRLHLVNGTLGDDGIWTYLLVDTSRANVSLIANAPVVKATNNIDRDQLEVTRPTIVRRLGPAPLQSFVGFGLGVLLLVGSSAPTTRLRKVYAGCAFCLLVAGMISAPFPIRATDNNGEWMGDYEYYTESRASFERYFGRHQIPFPHHLTAIVLASLDSALGATDESPAHAFRWLSVLAGIMFVAELLAVAILQGWSAGVMRYLALCVAAPVTLLFFGFREVGYLSLSAAGIPLLMRGLAVAGRKSTVIASAIVLGLRSALHGFGLLSLAGASLSALASVGTLRDRLTRGTVFGVWFTTAYLGWVGWYLVGLKLPVVPGHAANIFLRPLTTAYEAESRIVQPILSGSGLRDIFASAVIVGVPVLLLGLWRGGAPRERRLGMAFALPSLAFLVMWWPVQGMRMEMDLIFAAFPAFFVGAWLCSRTRAATVVCLFLLALSHGAFWSLALNDGGSAISAPRFVPQAGVESRGEEERAGDRNDLRPRELAQAVQAAFDADPILRELDIAIEGTSEGLVYLRSDNTTQQQRELAVKVAQEVRKVVAVADRMK